MVNLYFNEIVREVALDKFTRLMYGCDIYKTATACSSLKGNIMLRFFAVFTILTHIVYRIMAIGAVVSFFLCLFSLQSWKIFAVLVVWTAVVMLLARLTTTYFFENAELWSLKQQGFVVVRYKG